jgi:hypothetical protein
MRESESFFVFFTSCPKNIQQNLAFVRLNICFVACLSKCNAKDVYVRYCRTYCDVTVYDFLSSVFSLWNFVLRRKEVKGARNFTHFTKENTSNGRLLVESATLLALVEELCKLKIHPGRNPVRVT